MSHIELDNDDTGMGQRDFLPMKLTVKLTMEKDSLSYGKVS